MCLSLHDGKADNKAKEFIFYVGVVSKDIPIDVKVFEPRDLYYYGAILAILVLSLLLSTYCVF